MGETGKRNLFLNHDQREPGFENNSRNGWKGGGEDMKKMGGKKNEKSGRCEERFAESSAVGRISAGPATSKSPPVAARKRRGGDPRTVG